VFGTRMADDWFAVDTEGGDVVPRAGHRIRFQVDGPGEIVATDNGDPTSFEPFRAGERNAFSGLCLVASPSAPESAPSSRGGGCGGEGASPCA
jgi:Glycoside hydrolase family 2 C-terminal domain 5